MIGVGLILLYLGIRHQFEPLLLVPIGFGAVLSNIPLAGLSEPGGLLYYVYEFGITTGIFPLIIFMGVGAMTDFGPMLANPKTALLGGAAQFGIFGTLLGALALNNIPGIDFSLRDAASIGIIGGADGPTAIFLSSQLSPRLLGSIAIAAYSYMALVPIIQPPIMRFLTSQKEREIEMTQLRYVSTREKILFPMLALALCALLLPFRSSVDRHVHVWKFGKRMRCGQSTFRHYSKITDQYCDYFSRPEHRQQISRRRISQSRNGGNSHSRYDRVFGRHRNRCFDGQADEQPVLGAD